MNMDHPVLQSFSKYPAASGLCAIGVMAKAPVAGAAKTRLTPPLLPQQAAALSVCFLRDTTENITCVAQYGQCAGVAVYTPAASEPLFNDLLPPGFQLLAQRGDEFGERLLFAVQDLLSVGYDSVCLLNSDSPTLPSGLLHAAVSALAQPRDCVVLGAAEDGGYYLIGLKQAHCHLFSGIEWSTERVLTQTLQRAAELDLQAELLPIWYDVDDAASLHRLCQELLNQDLLNQDLPNKEMVNDARSLQPGGFVGYAAPHTREYLGQLMASRPFL